MKKIAAIVLSALFAVTGIISASAASTLADGTYAVDLKLMHAEKDQESMGNKYVGQRGLLKVSGGSYQVYIVPADGYDSQFDQVAFKYYQNGSTEGAVSETQTTQNVEIDGVNHAKAVTFTMPNQSGTCGLQFKVPIVGMTVSAKLVVDLSSAKLIEEPTTKAPVQQAAPEGQEGTGGSHTPDKEGTPGQQTPAVEDTQPVSETVSESDPAETTEPVVTQPDVLTAEESTTGDPEMTQDDGNTSTVWVIVGVVAVVVVAGGVIAAVVVKKKKG